MSATKGTRIDSLNRKSERSLRSNVRELKQGDLIKENQTPMFGVCSYLLLFTEIGNNYESFCYFGIICSLEVSLFLWLHMH